MMTTDELLNFQECQYAQLHGQDVVIHCAAYYHDQHSFAHFLGWAIADLLWFLGWSLNHVLPALLIAFVVWRTWSTAIKPALRWIIRPTRMPRSIGSGKRTPF